MDQMLLSLSAEIRRDAGLLIDIQLPDPDDPARVVAPRTAEDSLRMLLRAGLRATERALTSRLLVAEFQLAVWQKILEPARHEGEVYASHFPEGSPEYDTALSAAGAEALSADRVGDVVDELEEQIMLILRALHSLSPEPEVGTDPNSR